MAEMTDTFENNCINRFLRNQTTAASDAFVGFASAAANVETGSVTEISTGAGTTDYARVACGFSAPSTGTTSNASDISFTESTAGYGAAITHVCVWGASSGGTPLLVKALGSSKTIGAGDTPKIAAGALVVTFD